MDTVPSTRLKLDRLKFEKEVRTDFWFFQVNKYIFIASIITTTAYSPMIMLASSITVFRHLERLLYLQPV